MSATAKNLPPYVCVSPSNSTLEGELFNNLRACEGDFLNDGKKIRIIVFDLPNLPYGIAFFEATQNVPSDEQIARIYNGCMFGPFGAPATEEEAN